MTTSCLLEHVEGCNPMLGDLFYTSQKTPSRFWWENPGVFIFQQCLTLSGHSLLRLISDNMHIKEVPMDFFKVNLYPSDFVNCQEIRPLDLSGLKISVMFRVSFAHLGVIMLELLPAAGGENGV
ncbi:lactoperoxidase-like isoform X1 [Hemicordylus capensis]|uniref:lactoperoxidase-like isoform X1 n=1 Tax=Hemicordylus capensis TaxID=884348 RepID=UPI0023030A0A|nr:lactoperoxidase-like isoform X1 [Hemicordylus capensis]